LGISRRTVRKYLEERDFSPAPPLRRGGRRAVDEHREWIDQVLEADKKVWRKQRHTAKRLFGRLVSERGCTGS
jgi:transposase